MPPLACRSPAMPRCVHTRPPSLPHREAIFHNILHLAIQWPAIPDEMSLEAYNLLSRLLVINQKERLGSRLGLSALCAPCSPSSVSQCTFSFSNEAHSCWSAQLASR